MKKKIFLLIILLNTITITSQDLPAREIITPSNFIAKMNDNSNNKIEGSIFYNKKWNSIITINVAGGKKYTIPKSNFSLKDGVFVMKTASDSIYKIEIDNISSVIFDQKQFEFIESNFYERLSKGKINIFKQYYLKIEEGRMDAISKAKITKDKYKKAYKYFIKTNYGLTEFKLNKKKVLQYFDESKKSKMKKFIKKNSLKYKKEKDLKKILEYYNTL